MACTRFGMLYIAGIAAHAVHLLAGHGPERLPVERVRMNSRASTISRRSPEWRAAPSSRLSRNRYRSLQLTCSVVTKSPGRSRLTTPSAAVGMPVGDGQEVQRQARMRGCHGHALVDELVGPVVLALLGLDNENPMRRPVGDDHVGSQEPPPGMPRPRQKTSQNPSSRPPALRQTGASPAPWSGGRRLSLRRPSLSGRPRDAP